MIPEGKLKDFLRTVKRNVTRHRPYPRLGDIDLGSLDRVTPVSNNWGFDRGQPVDRVYIEKFLSRWSSDIHGRVLEVYNDDYTTRFGGDNVQKSDKLHDQEGLDRATIVFDLCSVHDAPASAFDCVICTQTLHLIFDTRSAIQSLHKVLCPGGTLLLTVPGISATPRRGMGGYTDYWRFTSESAQRLFGECFGDNNIAVEAFGNVYAATAFLHGLAAEELDQQKLDYIDPDYEMVIGVRAVRKQGKV